MKHALSHSLAAAALALSGSAALAAPVLLRNAQSVLTGVDDIDIGGTLYDVAFGSGSCSLYFGNACTSTLFSSLGQASAAQSALLSVLSPAGLSPTIVGGCDYPSNTTTICTILTAFKPDDANANVSAMSLLVSTGSLAAGPTVNLPSFTSAGANRSTYALWSAATVNPVANGVSEPGTLASVALALGLAAGATRRQRRQD
jgi:hypothetical protein